MTRPRAAFRRRGTREFINGGGYYPTYAVAPGSSRRLPLVASALDVVLSPYAQSDSSATEFHRRQSFAAIEIAPIAVGNSVAFVATKGATKWTPGDVAEFVAGLGGLELGCTGSAWPGLRSRTGGRMLRFVAKERHVNNCLILRSTGGQKSSRGFGLFRTGAKPQAAGRCGALVGR